MRDLEHKRKGEIKELVTLQNIKNTMEYAHVFLKTEDPSKFGKNMKGF